MKREQAEPVSLSFDWYGEGDTRTVEVDGIEVVVKFVARKGRRARIAITAPAGATFRGDGVAENSPSHRSPL